VAHVRQPSVSCCCPYPVRVQLRLSSPSQTSDRTEECAEKLNLDFKVGGNLECGTSHMPRAGVGTRSPYSCPWSYIFEGRGECQS
jgi:hypothetical protein